MMKPAALSTFAALFALAACAAQEDIHAAAADPTRDCFNINTVSGFNAVDDDTVRVSAGASRTYELDLRGPGCSQVEWTETIALESRPSPWICTGSGPGLGEVHFRESGGGRVRSCFIESARRLPPPAGS
jgi:hypothetical protein